MEPARDGIAAAENDDPRDAVHRVNEPAEDATLGVRRAPRAPRYLFLVGLAVYIAVVWYFGWREVRDALLETDARLVGAAGAILAVSTWSRIYKWRYALGPGQHAIGLYFLSKATGLWSPGRLGEFLPLLWRRHRKARVGAWILLDRVLEVIVTLALGLLGLGMIRILPVELFVGVVVAAAGLSAFAVYLITRRDLLRRWSERWVNRPRVSAVLRALAETSGEVRRFTRAVPVVVGITVASKAADLFAVVLIFKALGHDVGFMLMAAAKCALALVSFLPVTPVATGVPHAVQGWIMNEVASVPPEAIVVSVGFEAVLMLCIFWTSIGIAARAIKDATF